MIISFDNWCSAAKFDTKSPDRIRFHNHFWPFWHSITSPLLSALSNLRVITSKKPLYQRLFVITTAHQVKKLSFRPGNCFMLLSIHTNISEIFYGAPFFQPVAICQCCDYSQNHERKPPHCLYCAVQSATERQLRWHHYRQ